MQWRRWRKRERERKKNRLKRIGCLSCCLLSWDEKKVQKLAWLTDCCEDEKEDEEEHALANSAGSTTKTCTTAQQNTTRKYIVEKKKPNYYFSLFSFLPHGISEVVSIYTLQRGNTQHPYKYTHKQLAYTRRRKKWENFLHIFFFLIDLRERAS